MGEEIKSNGEEIINIPLAANGRLNGFKLVRDLGMSGMLIYLLATSFLDTNKKEFTLINDSQDRVEKKIDNIDSKVTMLNERISKIESTVNIHDYCIKSLQDNIDNITYSPYKKRKENK